MFCNKILSKTQWICLNRIRFRIGEAGCIGLALERTKMGLCVVAGRQVVLFVASFDQAHGDSSGSVAYLNVARLERSLECQRREGGTCSCLKHTPNGFGVPTVSFFKVSKSLHTKHAHKAHPL